LSLCGFATVPHYSRSVAAIYPDEALIAIFWGPTTAEIHGRG
jgi:hypothetical protein